MHEADDAYSIRSTWSCYWLDQFLTPALNILILSIFTFQWICLPILLLILVGVELSLRVVVTILECCVTFSGVKLSIRSFVLFISRFGPYMNKILGISNGNYVDTLLLKKKFSFKINKLSTQWLAYSTESHVMYCILVTSIKTYHLEISFTLSQ